MAFSFFRSSVYHCFQAGLSSHRVSTVAERAQSFVVRVETAPSNRFSAV